MLLVIFQEFPFEFIILFALIPVFILAEIISMKIGLIIVKARERKSIAWVGASVFIQIGIIFLVFMPLIMIGIAEGIRNSDVPAIILMAVIAVFVDFNLINLLHKLGFKRSLIVLIFFSIPLAIFGNVFGFLIS